MEGRGRKVINSRDNIQSTPPPKKKKQTNKPNIKNIKKLEKMLFIYSFFTYIFISKVKPLCTYYLLIHLQTTNYHNLL